MRAITTLLTSLIVFLLLVGSAAAHSETKTKSSKPSISTEEAKKYDLALEAALVNYEKAQLYYKKDKLQEAAAELEKLIAIDFPKGSEKSDGVLLQLDAHAFLGDIYLDLDKPKKAKETLEAGIKIAPDASKQTYQLYMGLGHVLKNMNQMDKALEAFEKAEKINDELRKKEESDKAKSNKK